MKKMAMYEAASTMYIMDMKFSLRFIFLFIILSITLITSSCTQESDSLKIGMMPAVDIAPFYHAKDSGIFESFGLDVELVMFTNAQNRQTALQTHQIDGAMTDLVALVTHSVGDFPLTGVLATEGIFPLLTTNIEIFSAETAAQHSHIPRIGVMEVSVSNYVAQQYMYQYHGIKNYEKVFIAEIPARLEAVRNAQVDAGIFPEPVASIGEMNGLYKKIYDEIPFETLDIIAFTDKALHSKPDEVQLLVQAYSQAAAELRNNNQLAIEVLLRHIPNLPPAAAELILLPKYRDAHLQPDFFIQEIINWTAHILNTELNIAPNDLIDRSYISN